MGLSIRQLSIRMSLIAAAVLAVGFAGCGPKTARPLDTPVDTQTDGWGLRKLQPSEYPDMTLAWVGREGLLQALEKSQQFLAAPSSKQWYPSKNPGDTITHEQIQATLADVRAMVQRNASPQEFQAAIMARYDVYTSIGYNNQGDVWFTGYFTPIYSGSKVQTAEYKYPIYSRPADLQTDPITGSVTGQYPTRRELLASGKLKGLELLWFKKPIEPFMIQVQGSAKVRLPDGTELKVGYAGSNDRQHKGLGTLLRDEGKIDPKHLSLPAVMAYYEQHPDELEGDVLKDDRFTFQKIYTTEAELREWPTGSLNVQVTTDRSIATDKDVFPRASLALVVVDKPTFAGTTLSSQTFMLDQDRGGAIRAAGRADLYFGIGDDAGARAGQQFAQGRLYYIFIKPEFIRTVNMTSSSTPRTAPISAVPVSTPRPAAAPARTPARPAGTPARVPASTGEMFPGAVRPG